MSKKYKYRFKTKEEFISDFGQDWRSAVRCSFISTMDCLLGIDIEENYYNQLDYMYINNNRHNYVDFVGIVHCNITLDMIKRINLSPSLEPKKFVY